MERIANFGAEAHMDYIVNTLEHYNKTIEQVDFIVGDNCSTNGALADLMRVPIVGCASHRLNKAAQEYYSFDPELVIIIDKVNNLMVNLRTLKNASILRTIKQTNGVLAKTRNATRWSSEFWMITRFLVLYPHLYSCGLSVETISKIPVPMDVEKLNNLMPAFLDIHQVIIDLQSDEPQIILEWVRYSFDLLCEKYPVMRSHLASNAMIVHKT
jgi:hypothetical protein